MAEDIREALARSICMSLRSYRKDGTPVDTVTWVTRVGDRFVAYTDDRSYKAKRLRRNPNIELAASDAWGLCSTPRYPGLCRIVEAEDERARYFDAIRQKYGIHWKLSLWGSLLVGRVKHRLVLECTLSSLVPVGGADDFAAAPVAALKA